MSPPSAFRQAVPRPASAQPGEEPPWARVDPASYRPITIAAVGAALARPAADVPVGAHSSAGAAPDASVLVPVFERDGEAAVVLTRRAAHLRSNPGDLSFPGGRIEAGEDPLAAALREANEEVGLEPRSVELLGSLPLLRRVSNPVVIAPFVGSLSTTEDLRPNGEVEEIISVPLACLLEPGVCWEEVWRRPQGPGAGEVRVPFFAHRKELEDDVIWGATARILVDLLVLITGADGRARALEGVGRS